MPDLAEIIAENQKEMMKLGAPVAEKPSTLRNVQDSDSETENISVALTSTPVKVNTVITKTTPVNSRNSQSKRFLFKFSVVVLLTKNARMFQ